MAGKNIETVFVEVITKITDFEISGLTEKVERVVGVTTQKLERLQTAARKALAPLGDVSNLGVDTGTLQHELATISDDFGSLVRRIKGLKDEDVKVNFGPLEQQARDATQRVSQLIHRIEELSDLELGLGSGGGADVEARLTVIRDKLGDIVSDVTDLNRRADTLDFKTATQEVEALATRVEDLKTELVDINSMGVGVPRRTSAALSQLSQLGQQLDSIRAALAGVSGVDVELDAGKAQAAIQELNDRLEAAIANVVRLSEENPTADFSGMLSALKQLQEQLLSTAEAETLLEDAEGPKQARREVKDLASSLDKVETAAQAATDALGKIGITDLGEKVDTTQFRLKLVEAKKLLKELQDQFKVGEDGKINVDTEQMQLRIKATRVVIEGLKQDLKEVKEQAGAPSELKLNASKAINALSEFDRKLAASEQKVGELDGRKIEVAVQGSGGGSVVPPGLVPSVNALSDGMGRATNQVSKFEAAFGNAFRRLLAFGAIQQVTQNFAQLVRQGIHAAGEIQNVTVALNRFFVNAGRNLGETSQQFIQSVRTIALKTPFEFKDLTDTSRRLLAMGDSAQEASQHMTTLADAVSSVGGSQGDIDGTVKALSQLASKGKVDLQDLRQISEHLPNLSRQMQIQGIIDQLNEVHPGLNATRADFDDLRKSGLITGQVLEQGILRAMKDIPGAAGAAEAASSTLQGALSNLRDFVNIELADSFKGTGRILSEELLGAFGSQTEGAALTPLTRSVEQFSDALGRATGSSLPPLIRLIEQMAPEVSHLVNAFGDLAKNGLPLLSNIGTGAIRSLTGFTKLLGEVAHALDVVIPGAAQETIGSFVTLAVAIPGAGEALTAGFKNLPKLLGQSKDAALQAALALDVTARSEEQVGLVAEATAQKSAVMWGAITGGGILILNAVLTALSDIQAQTDKWNDSVQNVAKSFDDVGSASEAVNSVVADLFKSGDKITLQADGFTQAVDSIKTVFTLGGLTPEWGGGLATFVGLLGDTTKALSANELKTALKTTPEGLSKIVEALARAGAPDIQDSSLTDLAKIFGDAAPELDKFNLSLVNIEALSGEVKDNLVSLAKQIREGAQASVAAAGADTKYALVNRDLVKSIQDRVAKGGDAVAAVDELTRAQNDAAQAAVMTLRAQGADDALVDRTIEQHTQMRLGIDGVTRAETDWVAVMLDVQNAVRQNNSLFDDLKSSYAGLGKVVNAIIEPTGSLAGDLVRFARGAKDASFGTDEFNAVASKLGDSMKALTGGVLSGDELQKISGAINDMVSESTDGLEAVVQGIDDLQNEADSFSLDSFMNELKQIAIGRLNSVDNLNKIIDKFGDLGAQAIGALTKSKLSPEQFGLVINQILREGFKEGTKDLSEIVFNTAVATGGGLDDLARRLAEHGLTPEKIKEILGTNAFEKAGSELAEHMPANFQPAVDMLKAQTDKLHEQLLSAGRLSPEDRGQIEADFRSSAEALFRTAAGQSPQEQMLRAKLDNVRNQLWGGEWWKLPADKRNELVRQFDSLSRQVFELAAAGPGAAPGQVPGVDVEAAKASATTAGDQIGASLTGAAQKAIDAATPQVTASVTAALDTIPAKTFGDGQTAGEALAASLTFGFAGGLSSLSTVTALSVAAAAQSAEKVLGPLGVDAAQAFLGRFTLESISNLRAYEAAGDLDATSFVGGFEGVLRLLASVVDVEMRRDVLILGSFAPQYRAAGSDLGGGFATAFEGALSGLAQAVSAELLLIQGIMTGFSVALRTTGFSLGEDIAQGMKAGIDAETLKIAAAASDAVVAAEEAARKAADSHSPSKLFEKVGRDLAMGIVSGLKQGVPAVESAGASLIGAAAPPGATTSTTTHNHTWNISVPADDPQMFTRRVADRIERRIS